MRRTVIAKFAAALVALVAFGGPQPSHAQGWPAKPVKIVVAFAPGGAADLFARLLAAEMSTTFNQQFYVENIAGSAGAIGTGQAARAQPDGYTLLIGGAGPLLTSPAINPNVGYDALRDFSHIAMIAGDGYVLISNPASRLKAFKDARQASSQNALTVGSPGAGSLGHLIIEQIKRKAGMQLQHVPFRSAGETMTAVLGDHVAMAIQTFSSAGEQVRAGKVIGLAVVRRARSSLQGFANVCRAGPRRDWRHCVVLADRAGEALPTLSASSTPRSGASRSCRRFASVSRTTRW